MSGLLFLNDLLEDMSVERDPKLSWSDGSLSAGTDREPRGSVPPLEEADRGTDLTVSPLCSCQGVGVRSLDDRCRDNSCTPRVSVLGGFLTVDSRDNLATGTETFLPFRIHEQATDVNIFTDFYRANYELINASFNGLSNCS